MFNGTTKAIDIAPTTRLVDIQIPPEFMCTFNGKLLDVGTPLVEQGIGSESTIHVAPRGLTHHHMRAHTYTSHIHIVRGGAPPLGHTHRTHITSTHIHHSEWILRPSGLLRADALYQPPGHQPESSFIHSLHTPISHSILAGVPTFWIRCAER